MRILDHLGRGEGLPVDAIRAADGNRSEVLPIFLQALEAPAGDETVRNALFFVFHLLGRWSQRSLPVWQRQEIQEVLYRQVRVSIERN